MEERPICQPRSHAAHMDREQLRSHTAHDNPFFELSGSAPFYIYNSTDVSWTCLYYFRCVVHDGYLCVVINLIHSKTVSYVISVGDCLSAIY